MRSVSQKMLVAFVLGSTIPSAFAQTVVTINAQSNRHAISPLIYGVAFGTSAQISDLQATVNRYGGNSTSRYNWNLNADNRGSDWYFETYADASSTPGERVDTFIKNSRSAGAEPLITVPMLPYVGNLGSGRSGLRSFSVKKYGTQTATDPWNSDAGNGVSTKSGHPFITGNNPLDANVANSPGSQTSWVKHVQGQFGTATNGGLKYYIMDNEPALWSSTHRDVHPADESYSEILTAYKNYALAVRNQEPNAQIVGPEEWGWSAYFNSTADLTWLSKHNWTGTPPDMAANGGLQHIPFILKSLSDYQKSSGKQLLNIFSLHYYPQQGETSTDDSAGMQAIRNRSTRSLWDPKYKETSWINDYVSLIPRMKNWVSTYYPGLKTAITEYNWGDDAALNGATAQADVLGIFGREGLDMASRWTCPTTNTPAYLAMKIFRNYDGSKSTFGDTSVSCSAPNPDTLSAFASQRTSDGALTVLVINKVTSASSVQLNLAGFNAGSTANAFQINSATQTAIKSIGGVGVKANVLATTVPAQSVTLFVIPQAAAATIQYDFEFNVQGWVGSNSQISILQTSATQAFSGKRSLAVTLQGTGTTNVHVAGPSTPAGKTVTFHVWVPSGSKITAVEPFVQQSNNTLTLTSVPIASISTNSWNTITVNVPTNAVTPLAFMGVQFKTSAPGNATCYIDAISW
jgi:Glycoside hydrolase family 44